MSKNLIGATHLSSVITAIAFIALLSSPSAWAVPSFSTQTGQPCSTCHVGAFGPQLTQYGRDFKLGGYTQTNGADTHSLPLALMLQSSFTTTQKSQNPPSVHGFGPNNNFSLDQVSAFYAGAVTSSTGAFVQATYDGVNNVYHWDNADIRYAHEGTVTKGLSYIAGLTLNNNPTVQDLWNSTPAWGFPYSSSALAPTPVASTLINNGLAQAVLGAGAYASINNWLYLEAAAYRGLSQNVLNSLQTQSIGSYDQYDGFIPYWRVAVEHNFGGGHYAELGTYGLSASRFPGADHTTGMTDTFIDNAFDANYQWTADPDNTVSAHATYIHENEVLNASYALQNSANPSNKLNTFRADASYSYKNTYTPSLQYFNTYGTADSSWWGTSTGLASPNSQGYVVELGYVPFGKPDSPLQWINGRLALQYIGYTKFDGTTSHASDNNTIFVNLWLSLDPVAGVKSGLGN